MSTGNNTPKTVSGSNYRQLKVARRGGGNQLDPTQLQAAINQFNATQANQTQTQTANTTPNVVPTQNQPMVKPNRPAPKPTGRVPFQSATGQQIRQSKVAQLTSLADINTDLVTIYDKIKVGAKDGGIDRGLTSGGMGTFKSVMESLQKLKHTPKTKTKDWDAAVTKLETETMKWIAKDQTSTNPNRLTDEVSVRKRQTAQAIQMSLQTMRDIQQISNATDWNTYDTAIANAETKARNTKVAAVVALNPPDRIGGAPVKHGNDDGGKSDSYFIKDGNNLTHVFKPQNGEFPSDGYPVGGGAPREVLLSEFNDGMKELGFDFKVPKTTVAELNSNSFQIGGLNQDTTQVGVIIDAIPNAKDGRKAFKEAATAGGTAIADLKNKLDLGDVQDIAILDFMTFNLDRNPGNVMVQPDPTDPLKMRLIPIDAGNLLPPKDIVYDVAGFSGVCEIFATRVGEPNEPMPEGNMMTFLPQSQQPLTDDRITKLLALDPKAVANLLKSNNAKRTGSMAGKISEDTFELVEHSVAFLKCIATVNPKVSLNEIGKMYGLQQGFGAFMTERERVLKVAKQNQTQPDFSTLQPMVDIAATEARRLTQEEADTREAATLGGEIALNKLGWQSLGDNLTPANQVDILRNNRQNPRIIGERDKLFAALNPANTELPANYASQSLGEQYSALKELRTKRENDAVIASFPTGTVQTIINRITAWGGAPNPAQESAISDSIKVILLNNWQEFLGLGGENTLQACLNFAGGFANVGGPGSPEAILAVVNKSLKDHAKVVALQQVLGNNLSAEYSKFVAAVRARNVTDKSVKDSFDKLKLEEMNKFLEIWIEIKDLKVFRDYNQLVATSGKPAPKNITQFAFFVRELRAQELEATIGNAQAVEALYTAFRDEFRARNVGDTRIKDNYSELSPLMKAEVLQLWNQIKDKPAFLKYNELVQKDVFKQANLLSDLADQVLQYQG